MELYVCIMSLEPEERLWPVAGPFTSRKDAEAVAKRELENNQRLSALLYGYVASRADLSRWGYPLNDAGDADIRTSLAGKRVQTVVYPCGCVEASYYSHMCPEAQELWCKRTQAYHKGQETRDYADFHDATAAYRAHFG